MKNIFLQKLIVLCTIIIIPIMEGCHNPSTLNSLPVNKNASPEAKRLLNFLYEIKGKYILSGQHNFVSSGSKYDSILQVISGREAAVWGSDFSFMAIGPTAGKVHHCGPMDLSDPLDSLYFIEKTADVLRQTMINEAIRQHKRGKIITLMWHGCFPTSGDSCMGEEIWAMENRPDSTTMDSLTTEGTRLNTAWKKQADGIAGYLDQLQQAHIPVLWRPYHEMNGVWFWWCNQKNGRFIKLWRMMYDYFTFHHHLNNLLWVWDANAPRDIPGDEAWPYRDFFPGTEYVDVLAADVYRADYKQSHQDSLLVLGQGKPIALGEIGQIPSDTTLLSQPDWTWFMVWGYFINKYNDSVMVRKLFENPRVLTLDRLNSLRIQK